MLEEKKLELESLKQRLNDVCYMMIEAEGEEYFDLATEQEYLEYEINVKERDLNEMLDIYNSEGIV